jgi:hypothetical protein
MFLLNFFNLGMLLAPPEEAKDEAAKLLVVLNSLARMERPQHKNVVVGNVFTKARS